MGDDMKMAFDPIGLNFLSLTKMKYLIDKKLV